MKSVLSTEFRRGINRRSAIDRLFFGFFASRRRFPLALALGSFDRDRSVRDYVPFRRHDQGRASRIMLKGVSVARRTVLNPAASTTSLSLASPAWAPNAAPTSCDNEVGTQIIVDPA